MEIRNVPAQDMTTSPKMWPLTKSQWAVYYWLLAHSKWNSFAKQSHYFIYKNSYTTAQLMEKTGIKSRTTLLAAYEKLKEVGAIREAPFAVNAWQIYTTPMYTPMSTLVMRYLLAFNRYLDPSLTITTLSILARLERLNRGSPTDFTKSMLAGLLGKAKQNVDSAGIVLTLALLEHSGLVELTRVKYINDLGVECIRYTVTNIDLEGKLLEKMADNNSEFKNAEVEAMWERLRAVQV